MCLEASTSEARFCEPSAGRSACVQHRRSVKSGTRTRAHAAVHAAAKCSPRLSYVAIARSLPLISWRCHSRCCCRCGLQVGRRGLDHARCRRTMDRYVAHAAPPQLVSDRRAVQCFWLSIWGCSSATAAAAPLRQSSGPPAHGCGAPRSTSYRARAGRPPHSPARHPAPHRTVQCMCVAVS